MNMTSTGSRLVEAIVCGIGAMVLWEACVTLRARTRKARSSLVILRGLRPRHFGWAVLYITVGCIGLVVLETASPSSPWLTRGWWQFMGGEGNVWLGQTSADYEPSNQVAGAAVKALSILLPLLLILLVPLLAWAEERLFRRGLQSEPWGRRLGRQGLFGLVHMLVGVPLMVVPVLAGMGCLLLGVYLRRYGLTGSQGLALLESAKVHTAANVLLLLLTAGVAVTMVRGAG